MKFDPMNLPRAARWRASFSGSPGLLEFLGEQGGATLALAFASLFWPSFIEVRGCVILEERYDGRNFEEWWQKLGGNCSDVEAAVNHVHLWDVFDPDDEDVPDEALAYIGEILARTWSCALREKFPDRDFRVELSDEPQDYGPTLTVCSVVP